MHCLVFRRGSALQASAAAVPAKRHRPTASFVASPNSTMNALLVFCLPPLVLACLCCLCGGRAKLQVTMFPCLCLSLPLLSCA